MLLVVQLALYVVKNKIVQKGIEDAYRGLISQEHDRNRLELDEIWSKDPLHRKFIHEMSPELAAFAPVSTCRKGNLVLAIRLILKVPIRTRS